MRLFAAALLAIAVAAPQGAFAAPCKDAKGKFIKCPTTPQRCKDARGKFVKCGAPGARPAR